MEEIGANDVTVGHEVPEAGGGEDGLDSTVSTDKQSRDESSDIPDVGMEVEIAQLAAAADSVSWNEDAVGQEAPLRHEAAVGRVGEREAGAMASTPNTSHEDVLSWWEMKEVDRADKEVEEEEGPIEEANVSMDKSEEAICGSSNESVEYDTDCSCGGPPGRHELEYSDYDSIPSVHPDFESEDVVEAIVAHLLDQVMYHAALDEDSILECNVTLHSSGPWEQLEDMVELQPLAQEELPEKVVVEEELQQEAVEGVGQKRRRSERLEQMKFKIKRDNL